MNCENYRQLSTLEKVEMIGEIIHCMQNDNDCFNMATMMIRDAKTRGIFHGVQIVPEIKGCGGYERK